MPQPNLSHSFAEQLPDMVRAVGGTDFPAAELVVLNEPLARELGLDPAWLRSADCLLYTSDAADE